MGQELPPSLSDQALRAYQEEIYAPMEAPGLGWKEVMRRLQEIIDPYNVCLIKSEDS